MVIDFHTHFYPDKIVEKALNNARNIGLTPCADGTRAGLLGSMRQAGIDRAVGLPLTTAPEYSRGLLLWAKRHNEPPITMLGSIYPSNPEVLLNIEYAADLGFPGIKVHPEYQNFTFDDLSLDPVWEKIAETGMFLITHAGIDQAFPSPWRSNPGSLLAFHRRHKALKLVLAHGGSLGMWDKVMECLAGEDVWFDLAFVTELLEPEKVKALIRKHGAERCLFGTDSPWCDQARALENIRNLKLGHYEEEMILGGNALRLLDLSSNV